MGLGCERRLKSLRIALQKEMKAIQVLPDVRGRQPAQGGGMAPSVVHLLTVSAFDLRSTPRRGCVQH